MAEIRTTAIRIPGDVTRERLDTYREAFVDAFDDGSGAMTWALVEPRAANLLGDPDPIAYVYDDTAKTRVSLTPQGEALAATL